MERTDAPSLICLIPARAGSKRVKNKNVKPLAGHPVMAYTISAALDSGIFDDVIVSTDSEAFAEIARHYGASVPFLRRTSTRATARRTSSGSSTPSAACETRDASSTASRSCARPARSARRDDPRAWDMFLAEEGVDSLRAVEKCKQHPGKMWVVRGRRMFPLLPIGPKEQPWHSSQYPTLPEVYVQNASLEIAWSRVIFENRTIAGDSYVPFITEGDEGYDVNDVADWSSPSTWSPPARRSFPR